MESYQFFTKKEPIENPKEVLSPIKKWLVETNVIEQDDDDGLYFAAEGFLNISTEDWSGEIEFIAKNVELRHILTWENGSLMLPVAIPFQFMPVIMVLLCQ